jgi:hypothetical protein
MIVIQNELTPQDLLPPILRLWKLSADKIRALENSWSPEKGAPVYTVQGRYTARGWTEWTQGFQFGSALLQFDATSEEEFLELGKKNIFQHMTSHLTHVGVHDHGFNNVSTYGNLWRLMCEGRIPHNLEERAFYELALKCSGAIQARRWTRIREGGFIYSFNGPHSLFVDTMRSLRSLALAHLLGHVLKEENDTTISLLQRLLEHARTTATYAVYYGEGRDIYDVRGRVAHESIFNVNDGNYRCPNSQQGYSPFTTWTRGLAWAMCGFAEQLEFLETLPESELDSFGGSTEVTEWILRAACATCDFYIENTPTDGIPYWDTGAPGLAYLDNYLEKPAEPFNDYEPVDSSAAAIAAQGLLRLGRYLQQRGEAHDGRRYYQCGLSIAYTLLDEPYISTDPKHQGLLLHSVYHRPNGWDYVPPGAKIPCGESCMWGDYHLRELALLIQRLAEGSPYYTFYGPPAQDHPKAES